MIMWISDYFTGACSKLNCCHIALVSSKGMCAFCSLTQQQNLVHCLPVEQQHFSLWMCFVSLCLIVGFFLAGGRVLLRDIYFFFVCVNSCGVLVLVFFSLVFFVWLVFVVAAYFF